MRANGDYIDQPRLIRSCCPSRSATLSRVRGFRRVQWLGRNPELEIVSRHRKNRLAKLPATAASDAASLFRSPQSRAIPRICCCVVCTTHSRHETTRRTRSCELHPFHVDVDSDVASSFGRDTLVFYGRTKTTKKLGGGKKRV